MKLDANGKLHIREAKNGLPLNLLLAGDFCPRFERAQQLIATGGAEAVMAPLQNLLQAADLSIIQFETPLTEAESAICKSGPNIKCPPQSLELLQAWGGDVALLANNHTGDFDDIPVLETISLLEAAGFQTVGAGADLAEAAKPLLLQRQSLSIGIINVAENEFGGALFDRPGANMLAHFDNIRQVRELKSQVDLCLVITHGGNEHNPVPSPRVVSMSRAFVDAGADLVVNIHPHCPQGLEIFQGKPIVYSLGNFYFPERSENYRPDNFWYTGYMLQCQADRLGVFELQVIPTHFDDSLSKIEPLQGQNKKAFFDYINAISAPIAEPRELQAYHEAWAASQSNYVARLIRQAAWSEEDFADPEKKASLMPLRNIFTCEAHHELCSTWLRLFEQSRLEEAEKYLPQLQKWQKADFIKL
ncbi:MAG: CapA family protein [Lentisphaerae bacterium]|nr:CapA family protein [Lentisphaerota bacterium]